MAAYGGLPLQWEAPGEGYWEYDPIHFPRPVPRAAQAALVHGLSGGLAAGFGWVGQPLVTMDVAYVNDVMYSRMRRCELSDASRRTVIESIENHTAHWRDDVDRWYQAMRPARMARNAALQACEPSRMSDEELGAHLGELATNAGDAMFEHIELVGADDGVGVLLLAAQDWGLAVSDVLALLSGASPGSAQAASSLAAIRDSLVGEPIASIDEARARGPHVAAAIDDHLSRFGWWVIDGYDPAGPTLSEHPELLVRSLNADPVVPADETDALLESLSAQLGPERDHFLRLLDDARIAYGVRDDNEGPTILWPMGLLRRGLFAAAERLMATGHLVHRDDVFVLDLDELPALLVGAAGPTADEIATRVACWASIDKPPATLGDEWSPPPADVIDPAFAALNASWGAQFSAGADHGIGIGSTAYRGPARVCATAADAIDTLLDGEVLVTTSTNSAFNMVLPLAGALVTEFGGPISHAALVAREMGIPAMIGVADATRRFVTGQVIEVDPSARTVRVVESS
ncbi:MAG TPA: PEP-utilizing enzyme [Ilumatobacteraceae bacterium]|nr:PEP-utilizing enzyme [Ilumatobacteraceae bacterium]